MAGESRENSPPENSAEAPLTMAPREARPRRGPDPRVVAGGIAVALALGAVVGLVARPQLDIRGDAAPMKPATPQAARQASDPQLSVEVAPPVTQTLPEMASTPPPPAVFDPVGGPPPISPPPPRRAPPAPIAPEPPQAWSPPEPAWAPPAPEPRPARYAADPGFDCSYARSRSEEMVCGSPRLAAADRAMTQAYDQAIRAGVPPRYLREEQSDWLEIREDAARHSQGAVADVYDQRIAELRAMAREAGQ